MNKSLTIIGAGWLAKHFLDRSASMFEIIVTTSRTSKPLSASTEHYYLDLNEQKKIKLPQTKTLLLIIPFSRHLLNPITYYENIKGLFQWAPTYEKIIFTSSTSVYPTNSEIVDEQTPISENERAQALYQTERHILNQAKSAYILRLSGICGFDRNSYQKITSKTIEDANLPVNLIHAKDIIKIIEHLIKRNITEKDILNVTSSNHPTKEAYYRYLCNEFNINSPTFKHSKKPFKKVSNKKLLTTYDVRLEYNSPLDFDFL